MSIADKLTTLQNIKSDIKTSILNKGVEVGDDFTTYSIAIDSIEGGGSGKIDVAATGIRFGYSTFTEIPDIFDFSNVTSMYYMFISCNSLVTIQLLDTSNVKNMGSMFYGCKKLQSIPEINTNNVTNMDSMFYGCTSLTTIPLLNTGNVTNMTDMFNDCTKLQSIPLLECGNITSMSTIFGYSNINSLTYLGGFKNLKISITSYFLDKAPKLTTESLMNVINNLYDLTANGLSGKTLKFGSTNLNKLTEEQIAVATIKGWTLT